LKQPRPQQMPCDGTKLCIFEQNKPEILVETLLDADPTEPAAWNSIGDIRTLAAEVKCWPTTSPWHTARNYATVIRLRSLTSLCNNWLTNKQASVSMIHLVKLRPHMQMPLCVDEFIPKSKLTVPKFLANWMTSLPVSLHFNLVISIDFLKQLRGQ